MTDEHWVFTSESVSSGHPDKLCDAISDAILDACLTVDPNAKVAVETLVKGEATQSHIVLAGEVTISHGLDIPDFEAVARNAAVEIGYTDHAIGMDAGSHETCKVQVLITSQSAHINRGVVQDIDDQGAGDQGLMFGYACDETEAFHGHKGRWMPLAIALSQGLTRALTERRVDGTLPWSRPDGKSQVTVEHDSDGRPVRCSHIVIAIQHRDMIAEHGTEDAEQAYIMDQIRTHVIDPVIPAQLIDSATEITVNGTGRFVDPGGPYADAGLTGRKIIVDTYGGRGRHGGGAFSGKDPSKVDRSAAYAARWAAKHVVAAGLARECEIQLAYAIGIAAPVGIRVDTFGTGEVDDEVIARLVGQHFSFRPGHIIRDLALRNPIYSPTSAGGHFGREPVDGMFTWEALDDTRVAAMRAIL